MKAALALVLAALVALGADAAGRIYRGELFTVLVVGAAVLSVAIGYALANSPPWTVAPLSLVALAAYLGLALWWSGRAAGVPGALPELARDGIVNGIPRLLTALIPVEPQPDTVALPVLLVWLAGLAAAELGLRADRAPAALVPPLLVYAAALVLAGPHGTVEVARAGAFTLLAGAALALAAPSVHGDAPIVAPTVPAGGPRPRRAPLSRLAAGGLAGFVVLVAAVVPAAGLALPDRPRDPRALVRPPESDTLDENPLARISGWMQNPNARLLNVSASTPTRLSLAVLGDFDGVTWRVGATYRDAGRSLPPPAPAPGAPGATAPAATERVSQRITVGDLRGRLVPAVSAPREIEGIRVSYDPGSGTVLRPDGLHAGTAYTVVSVHPHPDPNLLPVADVPDSPAVGRFLRTGPSVPDDVRHLADTIAEGNAGGYQRASALERFLAEHYTFVTDAPSGHAYPNLRFFLLGRREQGGQRGTSEQFAAAYAVLGRLMGLPTRVVVGFRIGTSGVVHGADALAWPEVLFDGLGWVAFDPMPRGDTPRRPLEQDYRPNPPPPTPTVSPPTPVLPSASTSASSAAAGVDTTGSGLSPAVWWWLGGAVVAQALAAVAALGLARRRQTRRRLSTGGPADRIRGAWCTVLDALRLTGHRPPAHLSVTEVVAWASGPPGTLPGMAALAALANLVAFAPQFADESEAVAAVAQARAYARALRRGQPWWHRLLWTVRPGPLVWRHGTARSEGGAASRVRPVSRVRPAVPVASVRLHGHPGRHRGSTGAAR